MWERTPHGPLRTSQRRRGRWRAGERSGAALSTITHENDTSRQEMPRVALGPGCFVVTRSQLCSVGGARSVPSRSFSSRSRCVSLAACRAWLTRACPAAVEVIEARLIEARSASCRSHATSLPKPLGFLGLRRSQSCLPSVPRSSAIDSSTLRFLRKVVCGLCRSRSFESAVFSNSLLQTRSKNDGRARTAARSENQKSALWPCSRREVTTRTFCESQGACVDAEVPASVEVEGS